jgi:hypothetical protein
MIYDGRLCRAKSAPVIHSADSWWKMQGKSGASVELKVVVKAFDAAG